MSTTVLMRPINENALSWVFTRVREAAGNDQSYADKGVRAARARAPKLLKGLEELAILAENLADQRSGRTRRDPSTWHSLKVDTQEAQLLREAHKTADRGRPEPSFAYVYAAVGEYVGEITR